MYEIHNLNQFDRKKFYDFLESEYSTSTDPASKNLWHNDWMNHRNTIPYVVEISPRFKNDNGLFNVITYKNVVIGCGGVYVSSFSKEISLAGTRAWIKKEHRNKSLIKELLVEHKKWSVEKNCKAVALCFNDYNKNLIQIFKRTRLGENTSRLTSRESYNLFFSGVTEVPFPVMIQETPQWVIYEKLDQSFVYDWSSIAVQR
jgi:hypothetical protein